MTLVGYKSHLFLYSMSIEYIKVSKKHSKIKGAIYNTIMVVLYIAPFIL